jgi:hypothetical protein
VAKDSKKKDAQKREFLSSINQFLEALQDNPSLWSKNDLGRLHDFVKHAVQNPDNFPLESEVPIETLIPSMNNQLL